MKKTSIIISIILSLVISFIPLNNIVAEGETITVTFDGNGGLFNDEESLEVVVGEDGKIADESWPANPSRVGYNFIGFYINDELIDKGYVFSEDVTVLANWQAKTTNITLFEDDNKEPIKIVATFDSEMPKIEVPTKDGYSFLGYFNQGGEQYYGDDGSSSCLWNKEEETYILYARFKENKLLGEPVANFESTVTVNLAGGTIADGNIPEGWTKVSEGVFTKLFTENVYIYEALGDWYQKEITNYIVKEGQLIKDYNCNRYLTEYGDITATAQYEDAIPVTISIDTEHDGGTLVPNRTITPKSFRLDFMDDHIEDNAASWLYGDNEKLASIVPETGKGVFYYVVNGKIYYPGSSYYYWEDSPDSLEIVVHMADDYGVKVKNIKITSLNCTNVLKGDNVFDNKISYNSVTNELTINGVDDPDSWIPCLEGSIYSNHDMTLIANNYVEIGTGYNNDKYSIECNGNLTIKSNSGSLTIDATGQNGIGIKATSLTIDSGDISATGYSYGILVDNLVINSANKPQFSVSASTRYAIKTNNSITINGEVNIIGASEEYVQGTTTSLFQRSSSPIVINYIENLVDYYLTVSGISITSENKDNIKNEYGSSIGSYNSDTHTLSLKENVNIGGTGYGIYSKNDLIISLEGNAYFEVDPDNDSTGNYYGIYCEGDLTINGDKDKTLNMSCYSPSYYVNVGIFADGDINIHTSVNIDNCYFRNGDMYKFKISAGIWARKDINIIGSENNVLSVKTKNYLVPMENYHTYGLLAGDGNPGYDNRPINIKYADVTVNVEDAYQSGTGSCFGMFSYGSTNIENSTIKQLLAEANGDTINIYSDGNIDIKNSQIDIVYPSFYNSTSVANGIEADNDITIDNSKISILNEHYTLNVKKMAAIKADNNIIIKGNDTDINVETVKAVGDYSYGIFAKKKLDIQGGKIKAVAADAEGTSYGIYAGNDSFDGSHSIKNCEITASAGTSASEESVGFKTKKGNVSFDGAKVTASGKSYGVFASSAMTISQTNASNKTVISGSVSQGSKAIASKEIITINNNDYSIIGASNTYDPTSTSAFVQSGSDPIKIYYKDEATITGIEMAYPEGETSFTYGDSINCDGEPVVTPVGSSTPLSDIDLDDFTYTYYVKNEGVYSEYTNVPRTVGDYKLVATLNNVDYKGKQEIEFSINKKDITVGFDKFCFEYGDTNKSPNLILTGLVGGDTYTLGENNPEYKYQDENGTEINKPSNIGKYKIIATLDSGKVVIQNAIDTSEVLKNCYNIVASPSYCDYYICPNKDGNIYFNSYGKSDEISNITMNPIKKVDALKIAENIPILNNAIENNKDVIFLTELQKIGIESKEPLIDWSEEKGMPIDETNAIFFSINFYYCLKANQKVFIIDTNKQGITVTIAVPKDKASHIVGNNKRYWVLRNHGGIIEKIECAFDENPNDYKFTFVSDKFSDFALFSEDKPSSPSRRPVPNTGAY